MNLEFLKNYKYAHRGLHNDSLNIPENSLLAFKEAINNGYAIEFDVSLTKDLQYVCFHDKDLLRMCNINEKIENYTKEELNRIKLKDSSETIPSLVNALEIVKGSVPLLIEIKAHKNYKNNLHTLASILDKYEGQFAVFSFDYRIVRWFKNNRPNYIRGQISSFFNESIKMPYLLKKYARTMHTNNFTKPHFISYNINNIPNKYVTKAKENGLVLLGYTAFNEAQYKYALSYLDNCVFEGFKP